MQDSRIPSRLCFAVALALTMTLLACGGGKPVGTTDGRTSGAISGFVIKGAVDSGLVAAYALDGQMQRGDQLAVATTDEVGAFRLELPAYNGAVLLVASGGTYVDEASGVPVGLGQEGLTAVLPELKAGGELSGVVVTPVSHLVAGLTSFYVRVEHQELAKAYQEASGHLHNHFGALDWTKVVPADLTVPTAPVVDDAVKAGLLIAALSEEARTISQTAGLTPGSRVHALTLVKALYEDIAYDGFFDGEAADPLVLPLGVVLQPTGPTATRLDGNTARVALARGIENWLTNSRNKAALAPADVRQLQDDLARASNPRIFRTGGQGGFDNQPPTVSFEVRFKVGEAEPRAPVGEMRLVGGTLTVVATASDPSGLRSLELKVGDAPVPAIPQGNSAYRYEGTWKTGDDGPLTFTARAVDLQGNGGSATFAVTVDNTAPVIRVTEPVEGSVHATAIPVDATAEDEHGLSSFTVSGPGTVTNTSGVSTCIAGSWSVPAANEFADGPAQLRAEACDSVMNCATPKVVTVTVDRTPPVLELETPLPQYTKEGAATVTVRATDLTEVKELWVKRGSDEQLAEPIGSGRYQATVTLGTGDNVIEMWAVDGVGNSGQNSAAPHRLVASTFQDSAAPGIRNERPASGYQSEQNISLDSGLQLTGLGAEEGVAFGDTVFKTSPRLTWGSAPATFEELDGPNASNTPWLLFRVPHDSKSESPIQQVSYEVSCSGCAPDTSQTARGILLAPIEQAFNRDLSFALPLNAQTVPFLARLATGSALLTVTVTAKDDAGNTSSPLTGTLTFSLVAPPIGWTEEDAWKDARDPQSVYGYRLNSGTYDQLFSGTNPNFPNGVGARALRFRLRNPFPQPIVVTLAPNATASWTFTETWNNDAPRGSANPTSLTYRDAVGCPGDTGPSPCGAGQVEAHGWGMGTVCTSSFPITAGTGLQPYSATGWDVRGYLNPRQNGDEQTLAPGSYSIDGTNAVRVPAAADGTPGEVVLYVLAPRSRPGAPPLQYQAVSGAPLRYQYQHGSYYSLASTDIIDCGRGSGTSELWTGQGWYRFLSAARFSGTGSFTVRTQGTYDDGSSYPAVGAPRSYQTGNFGKNFDLTP